jgi:adenine-specific DNA-methyltransferase
MSLLDAPTSPEALLARAENRRALALEVLSSERQTKLGQFFTPEPVADLIAELIDLEQLPSAIRFLDPGAGTGSLTAAVIARLVRDGRKRAVEALAYEIDPQLLGLLRDTLDDCADTADRAGFLVRTEAHGEDFMAAAVAQILGSGGLFSSDESNGCFTEGLDLIVMNPPYRKIQGDSRERWLLAQVGIEVNNLYTAFLALASHLLRPGGQLVAITPRSFCNGPYFRSFRIDFLGRMGLRHLHVFESRDTAFRDLDVLQENVIFAAVRGRKPTTVTISASVDHADEVFATRQVAYAEVVAPADPEQFIRISVDLAGGFASDLVNGLGSGLAELGLMASTGRVVDFRAREYLRSDPEPGTVPLIYPGHFSGGFVEWPKRGNKKPNALVDAPRTKALLLPNESYVLVKRFSSKEEPRRVVAAVYDPARVPCQHVGFENHLNVFHRNGRGLDPRLARGLALYLNSTIVDIHFRQFSGHTQVNATDLRVLRYPRADQLETLGSAVCEVMPDQQTIDELVREHVPELNGGEGSIDPVSVRERIEEAQDVLKQLDFPSAQQNERSALTLLALLALEPDDPWSNALEPLVGITQMMEYFAEHYGKRYAPNTRETVRRSTVHQFVDAGLVLLNPDDPTRPTNSGQTVYQIERSALDLLRTYGTKAWGSNLAAYRASVKSLRELYEAERQMQRIPVTLPDRERITLSPGGQNVLIKKVIEEFCSRFAPGGRVLYVGDTDEKFTKYDREAFASLNVHIDRHGKMPDVIVHHPAKSWLLLVEAVTSHGPLDAKRHNELKRIFANAKAPLVFVTAFLSRSVMARYLTDISWETEVWCADAPSHMIHFDGERFLGPPPR